MIDQFEEQESQLLVQRASAGDSLAVDELIARHLPGLHAYVRARAGQVLQARESTGDVVQSTCREVLEHLDRFQYQGEEGFRRWLYTTALRKMRNKQKFHLADKRNVAREVVSPGSASEPHWLSALCDSMPSPSGQAVRAEEIERMMQAFQKLPEQYQEVLRLSHGEQLTSKEIGEKLGLSAVNVRVRLSRAAARLASLYSKLR